MAVSAGESASVTVGTTVKSPPTVGVPEITPVESTLSPAGRPVAVQVYGGVPPVAWRVTGPYGCPSVPPGRGDAVLTATCGIGTIVTVTVAVLLTFGGTAVSLALNWNVTVAPVDAPLVSVSVATHGVGEL